MYWKHGRRKGVRGAKAPWILKCDVFVLNFWKKDCFLSLEWTKCNFTTVVPTLERCFWPPSGKIQYYPPPWKNPSDPHDWKWNNKLISVVDIIELQLLVTALFTVHFFLNTCRSYMWINIWALRNNMSLQTHSSNQSRVKGCWSPPKKSRWGPSISASI